MATQIITTCDMHKDGSTLGTTIKIAIGRDQFELDLCSDHQQALNTALRPFTQIARRKSTRSEPTAPKRTKAALLIADLTDDEKDFARKQGWTGKRLSNEIIGKIQERRAAK